jgi:hypothetical protein
MSSRNRDCHPAFDRAFGPVVACRAFDFTLAFEHSIFDIGVSSLFIILTFVCLFLRIRFPEKTIRSPIYFAKAVSVLGATRVQSFTDLGVVGWHCCCAASMPHSMAPELYYSL